MTAPQEAKPYISFDLDGTLVDAAFTDLVWHEGIPELYAQKAGMDPLQAREQVLQEYRKVGDGTLEWYDIAYWFRYLELPGEWKGLLERYASQVRVYPEVHEVLGRLRERYSLIVLSNAAREFIEVEMRRGGLAGYFEHVFSATSDFGLVKKSPEFYQRICNLLGVRPQRLIHVGDHWEFDYQVPMSSRTSGDCPRSWMEEVMKIGVVSDSHGHVENLRRALKVMREAGADLIVHLGDDYDDVTALSDQGGVPITQVPGVFSAYYQDPRIPNRLIEEWEGVRVLLTHTPEAHKHDLLNDLKPEEVVGRGEVRMVLSGHSHIPEVKEEAGIIWVNPGHLKDDDKKGYPPTYALLEIVGSEVRVRILDLFAGAELFAYPSL